MVRKFSPIREISKVDHNLVATVAEAVARNGTKTKKTTVVVVISCLTISKIGEPREI